MVALGRVGRKISGGEQRAEKQPGAKFAADEVGVLALPAEPRRLRQRLLHHRRGVDEHFDVGAGARDEPGGELFEPALDDVVIIAMAGVDGDGADLRARASRRGDRRRARS